MHPDSTIKFNIKKTKIAIDNFELFDLLQKSVEQHVVVEPTPKGPADCEVHEA